MIYLEERMKIEKIEKLVANLYDRKGMCYAHKKVKTSIKPWISIKKCILSLSSIKKFG